jgi:hypothetical protein
VGLAPRQTISGPSSHRGKRPAAPVSLGAGELYWPPADLPADRQLRKGVGAAAAGPYLPGQERRRDRLRIAALRPRPRRSWGPPLGTLSVPRCSLMPAPTLESLLLQALEDDRNCRRLIGRLRPAVTGWHGCPGGCDCGRGRGVRRPRGRTSEARQADPDPTAPRPTRWAVRAIEAFCRRGSG